MRTSLRLAEEHPAPSGTPLARRASPLPPIHTSSQLRWYLVLWLGVTYLGVLWSLGIFTRPNALGIHARFVVLFTSLMLLHALLHWISGLFLKRGKRGYLLYALAQGVLVCLIATRYPALGFWFALALSLLLALIVEATVLLERVRPVVLAMGWYVALCLVILQIEGNTLAPLWGAWGVNPIRLTPFWLFVAPLLLFGVGYVFLYTQQVRAREQLQGVLQELHSTHRQLADYAQRVEALTRRTERQHLARELHDTLAQGLTGLIMQLEVVDSHLTLHNPGRAQALVQQAMARARETLTQARAAITDLRTDPPGDLVAVLQEELGRFAQATGLRCQADLAALGAVPVLLREVLLRVVSEGLANVARHAQAQQVWITASRSAGLVTLEVRDDGVGCAPGIDAGPPGHYGLLGLAERAHLAGGRLEVLSTPGEGTRLRVLLSIQAEEEL